MPIETPHILLPPVTEQEHAAILAALRYYANMGMGDPQNRPDWLHDIATNMDDTVSLDTQGVDDLSVRINTEYLDMSQIPLREPTIGVSELIAIIDWWKTGNQP